MAAAGQSGYVFKDSGTTPPAVADKSISWDHLEPMPPSGNQPVTTSPHQTSTSAPQTVTSPTSNHGSATAPVPDPATSGMLSDYKYKANAIVADAQGEFNKSFAADSHEIARQDHKIKGVVQSQPILESGTGVRDLGWHKNLADIPDPLIGGVSNGQLFSMIRRFNKDVFDVRATPTGKVSGLDLVEAWDNDHPTDKITLHLERLYLTMVLGMASFLKQISRLRSWKETRRTTVFCLVYFVAWAFDLLMPLVLGMLVVLIGSERARNVLFPPAPLALVNIGTGGLQKPQAGQLGTTDTLTGAPEKAEGEAREEEAASFVHNIRHIVMRAMGMHDSNSEEGDPLEGKIPKPIRKAVKSAKVAGSAPGHATEHSEQNPTQKPMEELMWDKANPKAMEPVIKLAPHIIGEIVDNWERFANAISPTPPFPRLSFIRINGVLAPLFLVSIFVPQYMVYKGTGFAIGFGLFGDPVISRGLTWLNQNYPNWMELLEPKNNILRGVPTNNQLTLTLLRIGEAHRSPIPPVPRTKEIDSNKPTDVDIDEIPLDASRGEVKQAIEPSLMPKGHGDQSSPPYTANAIETDKEAAKPKHKHMARVITFFKGNTKATVETKLAVDHVRAAAGSHKARGHLGVLPKEKNIIYAGPLEYTARLDGKKGWLYFTSQNTPTATSSTEPHLLFTTDDPRGKDFKIDTSNKDKVLWSIALPKIRRLKRATAFSNKAAEMITDWAHDRDLLGALEIDDETGKTWRFTAIPERDELFNRLVALGNQRWENM